MGWNSPPWTCSSAMHGSFFLFHWKRKLLSALINAHPIMDMLNQVLLSIPWKTVCNLISRTNMVWNLKHFIENKWVIMILLNNTLLSYVFYRKQEQKYIQPQYFSPANFWIHVMVIKGYVKDLGVTPSATLEPPPLQFLKASIHMGKTISWHRLTGYNKRRKSGPSDLKLLHLWGWNVNINNNDNSVDSLWSPHHLIYKKFMIVDCCKLMLGNMQLVSINFNSGW